jgi:hypothetical protein
MHRCEKAAKKFSRIVSSKRNRLHFVAGSGLCPTVTVHLLDILFVPHKISQKVLRNGSHPIPHPEPKYLEYFAIYGIIAKS